MSQRLWENEIWKFHEKIRIWQECWTGVETLVGSLSWLISPSLLFICWAEHNTPWLHMCWIKDIYIYIFLISDQDLCAFVVNIIIPGTGERICSTQKENLDSLAAAPHSPLCYGAERMKCADKVARDQKNPTSFLPPSSEAFSLCLPAGSSPWFPCACGHPCLSVICPGRGGKINHLQSTGLTFFNHRHKILSWSKCNSCYGDWFWNRVNFLLNPSTSYVSML